MGGQSVPHAEPGIAEPGRRERKKQATRRALRAAALRLFAERGFEHTTVEDITEAADVAPRTFFLHFASKEDALLGDVRQRAEWFQRALADRPGHETPLAAAREALIAMIESVEIDREELMLQARLIEQAPSVLARNLEHYTVFEASIRDDVARRCGRDPHTDMVPALVSSCAISALRISITVWARRGGTGSVGGLVREAFDRLGAGLADPVRLPTRGTGSTD